MTANHEVDPLLLWDMIQGRADDGETYTTLRHATLGMAVELWHDSMGAFHMYLPGNAAENGDGVVLCCFSSGIIVVEDAVCAPDLLFELCKQSRYSVCAVLVVHSLRQTGERHVQSDKKTHSSTASWRSKAMIMAHVGPVTQITVCQKTASKLGIARATGRGT